LRRGHFRATPLFACIFGHGSKEGGFSWEESGEGTEGTEVISVLTLVGVGAEIEFLSGRVSELIGWLGAQMAVFGHVAVATLEWFGDFSLVPFCGQWPAYGGSWSDFWALSPAV